MNIRRINTLKGNVSSKYTKLTKSGWIMTRIEGNHYIFEKGKKPALPKAKKRKINKPEQNKKIVIERKIDKIRNRLTNVRKELKINAKLTSKERKKLKTQAVALKKTLTSGLNQS